MADQDLLEKIATGNFTGGGILLPEQAKKFFNTIVDESVFMQYTRNVFMNSPVQEIDKISLGRVARPGIENTAPQSSDYVNPTTSKIELTTKKIIVPWNLTYEALEDNIEGAGFEDTMIQLISTQLANDIEELAIEWNTASVDSYLALMDGLQTLVDWHANVKTYSTPPVLSKTVFSDLLKVLPTKYRRNRGNLVFFVGANAEQDYRDTVSSRLTNMGDSSLTTNNSMSIYGINIIPVPFLDDKWCVLMPKNNFIVGIWRSMRLEKDKNIMTENYLYKISMRIGFQIENLECVAYTKTLNY